MVTATKTRETRTTQKRLSKKQRLEELQAYVALCFSMLEGDDTFRGLAQMSKLSNATIYRLWRGQYTLAVRWGTIQALGYAVGLRLELTEHSARVTLVD